MNNIVCFKDPRSVRVMSKVAIASQLYEPGGVFFDLYRDVAYDNQADYQIHLMLFYFLDDCFVGSCIIWSSRSWRDLYPDKPVNLSCFVKQEYRRRAIGRSLVEHARSQTDLSLRTTSGYEGSFEFWTACQIPEEAPAPAERLIAYA